MSYRFVSEYLDDERIQGRVIDIFMPEKVTRDTSLFFVHGGGWRGGTRTIFHKIMQGFNKLGFICASMDYRLNGVNIFDQIMDARHAYDTFSFFLENEKRPQRIFTLGSSAGAHLAALLSFATPGECGEALEYKEYKYRSRKWHKPIGTALQATPVYFTPWEDIFPMIWASMQNIVGVPYESNQELYKRVSPINYISKETCPVFFLEAENEECFPSEYNIHLVKNMKKMGNIAEYKIYTRAEHGFFYDLVRRQQKEAFNDILNFINKVQE
jgi:acetyl esterase/lipase